MLTPRYRYALVGLWGLVLAFAPEPRLAAQRAPEYEVKAAYLYNFTRFIEWPAAAFADDAARFRLCVYGDDPFGAVLDRTVAGETVGRHAVAVVRVSTGSGLDDCALVFVPETQRSRTAAVVRATAGRPVLTVGESPEFLARGGMIGFVLDAGHVRFDVDARAMSTHGLTVSSKLLRVARRAIGTTGVF